MKNVINISDRKHSPEQEIEAEAQAWVVKLDGSPESDDITEFKQWLNSSATHKEIFNRVASTWNNLDQLSEQYFLRKEKQQIATNRRQATFFPLTFAVKFMAVCLILFAGVVTIYLQVFNDSRDINDMDVSLAYVTAIGEIKTVSLPDGSNMQLNSNTNVNVAYRKNARMIYLDEGEAFFDVARDVKPFVVYVNKYAIKATGTAFSVKLVNDRLDVLVTEGHVEVTALKSSVSGNDEMDIRLIEQSTSRIPLERSQKAVISDENNLPGSVQNLDMVNIQKDLSWRDGMLIFDNDSLEYVITEINRYTPVKIIISDSSIRDIKFGGYFRIRDVRAILATMEESYDIHVDQINDQLVYLSMQK